MRRRVAGPTPTRTLAVRGVVATVVAVAVGVLLVARGAGVLDSGATVTAVLPSEAGRVPVNAPVHHQGVRVGDVRAVEGGVPGGDDDEAGTHVEMLLAPEFVSGVPADVAVRVVPRTLFGDVRLDLVSVGGSGRSLADGSELPADRSEEAVLLYDVFSRASDLLVSIKPDRMQVTLTALARALDGRGDMVGQLIADADAAGEQLSPALETVSGASADLAYLAEDLAAASPEIVETMEEATRLSGLVLARPGSLTRLLDAGLDVSRSGALMAHETVPGGIELVHDTGVVFDHTARDPHGVNRTLRALRPMGEAGAAAFSTGRFAITAVPSFADPMPYGPEDCPRHGDLAGSTCGPAGARAADPGLTVNAASERDTLRRLQAAAASEPGSPVPEVDELAASPDAAAWTMLGPLVRGTEVTVR